jgi:hypothetical protein
MSMGNWPSSRASRVLAALLRIGWTIKRQSASHRTLQRPAGQTWFSHFMMEMRLVQGCWLALLSAPVLPPKIYDGLRAGSIV